MPGWMDGWMENVSEGWGRTHGDGMRMRSSESRQHAGQPGPRSRWGLAPQHGSCRSSAACLTPQPAAPTGNKHRGRGAQAPRHRLRVPGSAQGGGLCGEGPATSTALWVCSPGPTPVPSPGLCATPGSPVPRTLLRLLRPTLLVLPGGTPSGWRCSPTRLLLQSPPPAPPAAPPAPQCAHARPHTCLAEPRTPLHTRALAHAHTPPALGPCGVLRAPRPSLPGPPSPPLGAPLRVGGSVWAPPSSCCCSARALFIDLGEKAAAPALPPSPRLPPPLCRAPASPPSPWPGASEVPEQQ